MAKGRTDAVRDAVERTVQATVGSAERTRGTLDELVKGAETGIARSRRAVQQAVGDVLPATQDDVRELHEALREIATRLDAIEERLPPHRSP